jgi:hypothetical protein
MKDINIELWITIILFVSAVISFFWKSAKKVETTDINLGHEVEKNKAEIVRLAAQISEDKNKVEERLTKIETIIINKAVTDALLAQNVEHISKTVDKIEQTQTEVLSKTFNLLINLQQNAQKGGSL